MLDYDVVVIGDYCFDMIFTHLNRFPTPGRESYSNELISTGGGMYITACALRRLGVRVGWSAYFGDDQYSRFVRDLATSEGIDMRLARIAPFPRRIVTTAIPFEGERAFVSYVDPSPDDLFTYWLESVHRCTFRHLHFGVMPPGDVLLPFVERARAIGATISADCYDGPALENPNAYCELLAHIDMFMPNMREARILGHSLDPQTAMRNLMVKVPLLIVKDGGKGAWVGYEDVLTLVPGIDPGEVIDTTGAGDCFNAGFLYGRLTAGYDVVESVRCGNISGGLSTTAPGGATAAPSGAALERWREDLKAFVVG